MPSFASCDGTELSYRILGDGPPLVCLPGGPGRAVEYFGDLGGLSGTRRLILLDPRGVGRSADPVDPATFGVDRLVADVAALQDHLKLDRMDLLAHSAGSVLATLYAAAHPERLSKLVLITPGLYAVGVEGSEEQFRSAVARLAGEPWYPGALAALEKLMTGSTSIEVFRLSRPLYYGRWDETAQAHATMGVAERHQAARRGYFAGVVLDPDTVVAALAELTAPVLLYVGEFDPTVPPAVAAEAAPLFNGAAVVVQPGAGHFPWVDDPAAFRTAMEAFLA